MGERKVEIVFDHRALKDLDRIHAFTILTQDKKKADQLIFQIRGFIEQRIGGAIDGGIADSRYEGFSGKLKKIIYGHYRISYLKTGNFRIVLRVFDTRQHPHKNR